LVQRLKTGAPLAEIDWTTVYGAGSKGYSEYPALQPENA
jgi:N-ethylmaleimide reductase